jgi:hypothetical protein
MSDLDCALKIAALTPPPCRQSILGNGRVSGCVAGILETGALYIEGIAREGTG